MSDLVMNKADVGRENTRDRLLDAAEVLFCEKGYEGTSIRDLTSSANCNVAAVNYYFGGKDKLYVDMFRRQTQFIVDAQIGLIDQLAQESNLTLEQLIHTLVYYPLRSAYEKLQRGQVMRLMVREVLNRSLVGEQLIEDFRTQIMDHVVVVLKRLMPQLDEKQAQLIFASIEALHLHPFLFMEQYMRMIKGLTFDELVAHIVAFGAAGIRSMVKENQQR